MAGKSKPLEHQILTPSVKTGANFGLGLITGLVASGIAAGIVFAAKDARVLLIVLGVLLLGKISFAAYFSGTGRRPGYAPGLLLSIGVVCLVLGGLCFAALKNI